MKDTKIKDRVLENISRHEMTIHRDDGLYRHIQFSQPGTNCYRFDLVTWPGYLCVTGDMGCWTFSRIADMFAFFNDGIGRGINPGYWSEKFESGTGHGRCEPPCYEFDSDAFDKCLQEWLACYLENCEDEDDAQQAKETISELTGNGFRTENDAFNALNDACFPHGVSTYEITEGMGSTMTYSFHYLWICYAIVWGIQRYNESKTAVPAEASHDQPQL
ncbi:MULTISPECIES: hypothetical protein [Dickeya]|uniref:Uncharacterized protein n=1 Tax=Dickeya undicola TaxID=1577887 RepID=A0A3N0G056_9GAMM|nr:MULTISPECIES: hypothetical protein [Dickeya]RNM05844.1 hypothetical protein EF878_11440 [Dickeya undicola]